MTGSPDVQAASDNSSFIPSKPEDQLDLSSCDREPIHIPGSIQPHGFLLALDSSRQVTVASTTAARFLHLPQAQLFGKTLEELLGPKFGHSLLTGIISEPLTPATRLLNSVELPADARERTTFDVLAHSATMAHRPGLMPTEAEIPPPLTILEFEQTFHQFGNPTDAQTINARLYNFVASIRRLGRVEDICNAAVSEIHALTGCDRVVLYRFDEAGHGLVLSETLTPGSPFASYLGLRFPASDVPAQARRMYELSPLFSPTGPAPEIDLSSSVLRSVSPIHRQYMRNMGTACSMSVSIIIDGKLWGLVSCHHHQPRYIPFRLRSACDFILQIVASLIESHDNGLRLKQALAAKAVQVKLLAAMAAQNKPDSYIDGLKRSPDLLRELVHADGSAVVVGTSVTLSGTTPTESQVLQLLDWLRNSEPQTQPRQANTDLFASHALSSVYPHARNFAPDASGVLAISVSRLHNAEVLWFRREQVQSVRWAGNPEKPAQPPANAPNNGAIDPRHSFNEWLQIVRASSEPWTDVELEAASDFRGAILEIVLGRAEELADMAAGLQIANEELEAFSYSVSHDLRAPFRHISGFSEMLRDEEVARMSEKGRRYLATIMESARFAGLLVDSLLDLSRISRAQFIMAPVDMEDLVDSEWHAVLSDADRAGKRSIQFSRTPLPHVLGDAPLLRQVLRNLFSNAVKYTGKRDDALVRVSVHVQANAGVREFIFSVMDNGVGFDGQYAAKLFGVFQRLHPMEEFEGTGIGLANVRRIIAKHGGRTWGESQTGKGATFYFTLPDKLPAKLPAEGPC